VKPLGLMALEDGAGIDFGALRADRRARVLAAMEERGVDVLVLGRRGNCKYVTGHRSLWRAVLTPWGSMCFVVRATGDVTLMGSTWDDGIPPEIPTDRLSGLMWNPALIAADIERIDGLATARTIGVDGMSHGIAALLAHLAPAAELADGDELMRDVRSVKLPAEVDCLRVALAIAEGAVSDALLAVAPGVTEVELKARCQESIAANGTTLPGFEPFFCATPRSASDAPVMPPLRREVTAAPLTAGDLVAASGSVLYGGYEGAATRTWPCPGSGGGVPDRAHAALHRRWRTALDAMVARCTPGTAPSTLRDAWLGTGEALPPVLLAHGVGIGVEPPVVGGALGPDASDADPLRAGTTLVVQGYVWEEGVGGLLGSDTVLVTDEGPVTLSRMPDGPLAEVDAP
jgi:Xaa-Pro aminopeptidase